MVHEQYRSRDGVEYGPYYYESYRGEDGSVKKRYLGTEDPTKKVSKKFLFLYALLLGCLFLWIGLLSHQGPVSFLTGLVVGEGNVSGGVIGLERESAPVEGIPEESVGLEREEIPEEGWDGDEIWEGVADPLPDLVPLGERELVIGGQRSVAGDISGCSNLTAAGTYTLTASDTTDSTCFNILAHNIILDCQGYLINYANGFSAGIGINNSAGYDNLTVTACNLTQDSGSGHTNSPAVYMDGALGASFYNNSFTTSGSDSHPMVLNHSNWTNVTEVYLETAMTEGILLVNASYNNLTGLGINAMATQISILESSDFNRIINTSFVGAPTSGVFVDSLGVGSIEGTYFRGNDYGLFGETVEALSFILDSGVDDAPTELIDETPFNVTFTRSLLKIENTTFGEIMFLVPINVTGLNFSLIRIGNNSVQVDTFYGPTSMNVSANVTLKGLHTGYLRPYVQWGNDDPWGPGDSDCIALGGCYNLTALTAGTVVFNVTGWSNYSVQEGDITPPGVTIVFPTNKTYDGTEFTVPIFNVTTSETATYVNYSIDYGVNNDTMEDVSSGGGTSWKYDHASIEGIHFLQVLAEDAFGNINDTETFGFVYDDTNPFSNITFPYVVSPATRAYVTSLPLYINATMTGEVAGTSSNIDTVVYSFSDGGSGEAINYTMTSTDGINFNASNATITDGNYNITVYSNDSANNRNYTTVDITLDTTGPAVSIVQPQNATYNSDTLQIFNVSATDNDMVDSVTFTIDNGVTNDSMDADPGGEYYTYTPGVADGFIKAMFFAVDASGNKNETEVVHFVYDMMDPYVNVTSPIFGFSTRYYYANSTFDVNVTLTGETAGVSSAIDTVWVEIDDGVTPTNTSLSSENGIDFNFTAKTLADGYYNITFYGNDSAGNLNWTGYDVTFDTQPPAVNITVPEGNVTYVYGFLDLNVSVQDTNELALGSPVQYTTDGGSSYDDLTNIDNENYTMVMLLPNVGSNQWDIIATDEYFNVNDTESVNFTMLDQGETAGGGGGSAQVPLLGGVKVEDCNPEHICGDWGTCDGGYRYRDCEIVGCGAPTYFPDSTLCDVDVCVPDWACSEWSLCAAGFSSRFCEDLNFCAVEFDRPEEILVCGDEEILDAEGVLLSPEVAAVSEGCSPRVLCEEWGSCQYASADSVLSGDLRKTGYRERACEDANHCLPDYIDRGACVSEVEVDLERTLVFGEEFLTLVKDLGDALMLSPELESEVPVADIDLGKWDEGQLTVGFLQGDVRAPTHCSDGVQNRGEENVDCGGPCSACRIEQKEGIDYVDGMLVVLFWVLALGTVVLYLWSEQTFLRLSLLSGWSEMKDRLR